MKLLDTARTGLQTLWATLMPAAAPQAGEKGDRLAADIALQRVYASMWVDSERRALVALMRRMDVEDGRVKRVHSKFSSDVIRGGLVMQFDEKGSSQTLKDEWERFEHRIGLNRSAKLKSDARGLVMEGNLPLQLVLSDTQDVVSAIRMPSDTIVPMVDAGGRFKNPAAAYEQRDVLTGRVLATFAAWQLMLCRLDPDNYDDLGAMGRPWLDSCAKTWKKLVMTEEDLVIRRRMRAPLRLAHVLEGADELTLNAYRKDVESSQGEITTDYYLNRKGSVTAIQGDSTLGEIADVAHLLDTFFAGSPAPRGLFGYTDGMARDILEDLKRSYYEEVDGLQDLQAEAYATAFRIHLLFKGIDPGPSEFHLRFAERRTETGNQVADLMLKNIAAGLPTDLVYAEAGYDPETVEAIRQAQAKRGDPYPQPGAIGTQPVGVPGVGQSARVSVTPGNAPKGESATAIGNVGGNQGRGRS